MSHTDDAPNDLPPNFIRDRIIEDRQAGKNGGRVVTRFPPEPNGYLHVGHAKSLCLNFGSAAEFAGRCHLRFDDTNPATEELEYVEAIKADVRWLGFDWGEHLFFASDYFEQLYGYAVALIKAGKAYVCSLSADEIKEYRGDFHHKGKESPYRGRSVEENLDLFARMRAGEFADGEHVLRAKIDMAAGNINMRDPPIYRIKHAHHHRTGDKWCIYPMYDYAHCVSDAIEGITHSLCTLEFEDHRPLYDWLLERLADGGFFSRPLPQQIEFARLNLSYTVTSKRKLQQLVQLGLVDGWDDPRMPTLVGLRRRGYTPESIQLFCERTGVSKANSWIDMSVLEQALRDDLEGKAPRAIAVLDPLKLVITNWPADRTEPCEAPVHPQRPELGVRRFPFGRELWIEREDFAEQPPKGFFRLFPGNRVRLRYGYVVECTGFEKDAQGRIVAVRAEALEDSKSGTPGANAYKVKGNLHWVAAQSAVAAEVRLYDRLFDQPHPDASGRDYREALNDGSRRVIRAMLEPSLAGAPPEARYQFERHGYFVADRVDSRPGAPVFNRAVTLKDSWGGGR